MSAPDTPSPMPSARRSGGPSPLHVALVLAILSILAFANTLRGGFAFDDRGFIEGTWLEQHRARPLSAFTRGSMEGSAHWSVRGYYRPLVTLSMVTDFIFWGRDPRGYHLTNILLHAIATLLAWAVLRRTLPSAHLAALTAGLFAIHPVHAESVAFVAGRTDVLYTIFLLLSVLFFLDALERPRNAAAWAGSLVAFAAALLSKETAACLPLILAALAVARGPAAGFPWRRLVPHLLALAAYLAVRMVVLPQAGVVTSYATPGVGLGARIDTSGQVLAGYLKTSLVPVPLAVDRGLDWSPGFPTPPGIAALVLIGALLAGVAIARRRGTLAHALGWFLLPLLPVANLIPTGTIQADRYLYLPALGACVLVAWALSTAIRRRPAAGLAALAAVGLCFLGLTIDRNRDWRGDLALWEANVADYPGGRQAILNYGAALGETGDHRGAADVYRRAIGMGAAGPVAHHNYGFALENLAAASRDPEEAARLRAEADQAYRVCLEAIEHGPARERLGFLRIAAGDRDEGLRHLRAALPGSAAAYLQLADAAAEDGDRGEEVRLLLELLRRHPASWEGAFRLGEIWKREGDLERARDAFTRVLLIPEIDPAIRQIAARALAALEGG